LIRKAVLTNWQCTTIDASMRDAVGWCDKRQATGNVRATTDASTRDKKNSRPTKATLCQNTDNTTYPRGEKSEQIKL